MALTPRQKNSLLWLYRGANLPKELGPSIAQQTAPLPATPQQQRDHRGRLLAQAIESGALQPSQLSGADLKLAGTKMQHGGGGILSKVGGLLGNLGSDIFDYTKGLPGGAAAALSSGTNDVLHLFGVDSDIGIPHQTGVYRKLPESQIKKNVIDPVLDSYAYTYAGTGAPAGSTFWSRFYQHPLGPILDAATVASLGTGGAIRGAGALSRMGIEARPIDYIAQAGKTTGRSPVVLNPGQQAAAGVEFPEVSRLWSSRPLRKAGQVAWDKLANQIQPLQNFTTNRTVRVLQRQTHATGLAAQAAAVRAAVTPLVGSRKGLSEAESTALDYALRGWNTPERIQTSREMFQASLDNQLPEGWNIQDMAGYFKTPEDAQKFVQYKANLPPEVEELILHPTDNMINAAHATQEAAQEGFDKLGLSADDIQQRIGASNKVLEDYKNGTLGQEVESAPVDMGQDPLENIPVQDAVGDIYSDRDYTRQVMEDLFPGRDFTDAQVNEAHENLRDDVDPNMSVQQYREGVKNEVEYWGEDPLWRLESGHTLPEAPDVPPGEPELVSEQGLNSAASIEGTPLDQANGQNLRNMVLTDGPGMTDEAKAEGWPSTMDMDMEMVRRIQERGGLEQGSPGLSLESSHTIDEFTYDTFVLRDESGNPTAAGETARIGGDIADYQEFPLSPDADLDALAHQVVDYYRGDDIPPELRAVENPDEGFYERRSRDIEAMSQFERPWDELTAEEQSQVSQNIIPEDIRPDHPIQPTAIPNIPAVGFGEQQYGWLAQKMGAPESIFGRGKRDRNLSPQGVTAQNMFAQPNLSTFRDRPEVLASGAARIDPKAFVESVARREKDLISSGYDQRLLNNLAVKGENGEPLRFRTQDEVYQQLGPDWVLVNEQFPVQWFSAENNFLQDTVAKLAELRQQGLSEHSPQVEDLLNNLADTHAQDFVRQAFNAQKLDGVAIPRKFYEYQRRLVTSSDPFDNAAGRVYARYMHRWRAFTLAYMPRWAINTAIGSFALNMVKGVTPRDYALAEQLRKRGVFGEPRLGGVELGGVTGMEYLEPGMLGNLERQTGIGVTPLGQHVVEKVQQIEDHFRRASFVHSLDKVVQRRYSDMGNILTNLERKKASIFDNSIPWSHEADESFLNHVLDDPELVQEAIDDLNTFAYNYAALGPYERRYVRMAVPFWGWYKFISKVAYRLPVEYPGRANILANIGMLGKGYEDQLGDMPDWLHGALPINMDHGRLKYFSTLGWNPFSSIINPLGPQGFVEGLGTLGQASPPIQAALSAFGLSSFGDQVPISPEQGVSPDYFGSLIDIKNGRETTPGQQAGLRRFVMGLLRSAPQFRMGEQYAAGGHTVYPESIPFFDQRIMPTDPKDTSLLANFGQIFGFAPKTYDLGGYQHSIKKRVKYAKARNKTAMKRLRKAEKG